MTESTQPPAAFGGTCAFALSLGPADKAPAGKPDQFLDVDGQRYLFAGAVPKFLFKLIPGSAKRAQEHWAKAQ